MPTTISKDEPLVTLINVFTVAPERQEELVQLLIEATEKVMMYLPGFVSANIHRGLDGRHVANYAQWRTREDFEAMLSTPAAQPHMETISDMAQPDPVLYTVVDDIALA